MRITPKLNIHKWCSEKISENWFELQAGIMDMGRNLHSYMINYIKIHKHRFPSFGNLEKRIGFKIDTSHPAQIFWGIGYRPTLTKLAPYWHVLNYGKKITGQRFIPGGGKYRPIKFGGSNANPGLRGQGSQLATSWIPIGGGKTPTVIRPINYIEATQYQVNMELRKIIQLLKMKR